MFLKNILPWTSTEVNVYMRRHQTRSFARTTLTTWFIIFVFTRCRFHKVLCENINVLLESKIEMHAIKISHRLQGRLVVLISYWQVCRGTAFSTKWHICPAKTFVHRISLRKAPCVRRLIRVFAWWTCKLVGNAVTRFKFKSRNALQYRGWGGGRGGGGGNSLSLSLSH